MGDKTPKILSPVYGWEGRLLRPQSGKPASVVRTTSRPVPEREAPRPELGNPALRDAKEGI